MLGSGWRVESKTTSQTALWFTLWPSFLVTLSDFFGIYLPSYLLQLLHSSLKNLWSLVVDNCSRKWINRGASLARASICLCLSPRAFAWPEVSQTFLLMLLGLHVKLGTNKNHHRRAVMMMVILSLPPPLKYTSICLHGCKERGRETKRAAHITYKKKTQGKRRLSMGKLWAKLELEIGSLEATYAHYPPRLVCL